MSDILLSPVRLSELEKLIENSVRRVFNEQSSSTPAIIDETPVSTDEAAKQFGIAKQTLYQNAKKIRHVKRFGRLYFYPADLRAYLNAGGA